MEQDKKEMQYIGETLGYHCYRNSDGFIEGYKHRGKIKSQSQNKFTTNWDDVNRVVSMATDIDGFGKFVLGKRSKKSYAPANVTQPNVFSDEVMEKLIVKKEKTK